MRGQGQRRLADAMRRCAGGSTARQALMENAATVLEAPLRVAVHGLPGVGSSAVAAALSALGFEVADRPADIEVRVVAEVVKPEDGRAIRAAKSPVLLLLTKADLCGFGPGGPVETARRRCRELAAVAGAPAEPMVGLLALAALDPAVLDEVLLAALRVLAVEPGDLRTAETFVTGPHRVPAADRRRLVDALDLFGIAHAVIVLRGTVASSTVAASGTAAAGAVGRDAVRAVLRRVSGVDAVAARIEELATEVRYRRLQAVSTELELAAATDAAVAHFLTGDDVVLAKMTAAMDVLRAAGVRFDADPTEGEAQLRRAVRWRRYGAGPVNAVHRACAADITRGSLRLWGADR